MSLRNGKPIKAIKARGMIKLIPMIPATPEAKVSVRHHPRPMAEAPVAAVSRAKQEHAQAVAEGAA